MIGKKFYKSGYDLNEYDVAVQWCNTTQEGYMKDKGEYFEVVENTPIEPIPIDDKPSLEQRINDIELALMELAEVM